MEETPTNGRGRIAAAVLGATGAVGQRFIQLLDQHPWFEVVALTGSERATGQKYGETCHWVLPDQMPEWARGLPILPTLPVIEGVCVVFSALPSAIAQEAEPAYALSGAFVCSNASAFRMEPDVPLLLPEVNPDHTGLIHLQRRNRNWKGCIVTNPNCTITGLTITLKALQESFGVQQAFIVSMQAISGAGYPGVPSMDILGNVIPFVQDEEGKMEWEPRKILGVMGNGSLEFADLEITAHANRVPVAEGHLICLSARFSNPGRIEEVSQALANYRGPDVSRDLPSAPKPVICVKDEPDRPQPRLDVMNGKGMTTVVGRIRPDPLFDYKMVILSHNTIRGAAGASIYNAELLVKQGFINL